MDKTRLWAAVRWLLGTFGWVLFWTLLAVLVIVGALEFHVLSGLFDSGVTVHIQGAS